MGAADFIMSGRTDVLRLSAAACGPILSLAFLRWVSKASPRVIVKRR
jgi:hypothetical protein